MKRLVNGSKAAGLESLSQEPHQMCRRGTKIAATDTLRARHRARGLFYFSTRLMLCERCCSETKMSTSSWNGPSPSPITLEGGRSSF